MISLREVIEKLKVEPLTSKQSLDHQVASGYASDLLSCVIKGAKKGFDLGHPPVPSQCRSSGQSPGSVGCHHDRGKSTRSGDACQGGK